VKHLENFESAQPRLSGNYCLGVNRLHGGYMAHLWQKAKSHR